MIYSTSSMLRPGPPAPGADPRVLASVMTSCWRWRAAAPSSVLCPGFVTTVGRFEVAEFVEELLEDCEVDRRQRQQEQDAPHHWRYHQWPAAPPQVEPLAGRISEQPLDH